MQEYISWEATLVKKFGSSNHFKLLNQLRNEVKKYPLSKKRNNSDKEVSNKYIQQKNNTSTTNPQSVSVSNDNCINLENKTGLPSWPSKVGIIISFLWIGLSFLL